MVNELATLRFVQEKARRVGPGTRGALCALAVAIVSVWRRGFS
jgi:hypothetical protein